MADDRARLVALIAQQPAAPRDHDGVMGSLGRLCAAAAQALSASGAAVAVMAEDGVRGATVASDPATERIGELQVLLGVRARLRVPAAGWRRPARRLRDLPRPGPGSFPRSTSAAR